MAVTPWGASESLRDRKLRPGPGSHNDEVAQQQRERLFAAMVTLVSERGYIATRVSDLVELSGVSSRTFYDLFADKQTCFAETIHAVLALAQATAAATDAEAAEKSRGWGERAVADFMNFAQMVAGQPAAARVVLIEAYGAGPEVLEALDEEMARFEWLVQQANAETPERAGMPRELVTAHVGALQEIARTRLRRGTEAELPGLMEEVARIILSYPPPPEPLRQSTRSPSPRPEDLDAHSHAERALRAFAVVLAEKGYAQTTVDEVIARASMSATTFYANFAGKEDVLMAAIDSAGAQVVAAVRPAFERSSDWPNAVRAAFGALFSFLATRPALAHLIAVGVYGGGPAATERRNDALAPLGPLIEGGGTTAQLKWAPMTLEVITGATYGLMYRQVREGGPNSLPALAPICTYLALAPFIGAEAACTAANGDGLGRGLRWPSASAESAPRLPSGERLLNYLSTRTAGVVELSRYLGEPVEQVRAELAALRREGLVEVFPEPPLDGSESQVEESSSSPDFAEMATAEWEKLNPAQRQRISAKILQVIEANAALAIEAGTFDARLDRHLSHYLLRLDERGWSELAAAMEATFDTVKEIEAKSRDRQLDEGDGGIEARVVLALFEMPAGDSGERKPVEGDDRT